MVDIISLAGQVRERLQQESVVFIDASLDEYWHVLNELYQEPYDVEYLKGQIRAKMSQASDNHETIVANMSRVLGLLFYHEPDIRVMGSNKLIYVPGCELAVNPDVLVMKGANQLLPRPGKAAGIINPYMLIEVQSDSTEKYDLSTKLRCYKQIESISQIIYIEQHQPYASVWTKGATNQHWLNDDYNTLDASVRIGDGEIPMHEIYHKILFTNPV